MFDRLADLVASLPSSTERWERGQEHHPKSVAIMRFLQAYDWAHEDYFDWSVGGDGDNGEELMYQLDGFFEAHEGRHGDALREELRLSGSEEG